MEEEESAGREYLYPVKAFPWDVCPDWNGRGRLSARREAIKAMMIANEWEGKSFSKSAYTEASRILTRWERCSPKEKIAWQARETTTEEPVSLCDREDSNGTAEECSISTDSLDGPQTEEKRGKEMMFYGDVTKAERTIWDYLGGKEGDVDERKSSFVLMSSIGIVPPQVHNHRELGPDDERGQGVAEQEPMLGDKLVKKKSRVFVPFTNKDDGRKKMLETTSTKKVGNMSTRAAKFAALFFKDQRKVQGLLYGGYRNRAWMTSLCVALYPLCTRKTVIGWAMQLASRGKGEKKSMKTAELLLAGIKSWALRKENIQEERNLARTIAATEMNLVNLARPVGFAI